MFDMSGLSEFAAKVQDLYGSVEEISKQLLDAGSPKVEQLWRKEILKNVMKNGTPCEYGRVLRSGHVTRIKYLSRSYGAMRESVSHETAKTFADIYPKGYDHKKTPVRNATKAFVLNYGRGRTGTSKVGGGYEGKHYVDGPNGINDNAVDVAIPAMQEKLNEILKQKGLV